MIQELHNGKAVLKQVRQEMGTKDKPATRQALNDTTDMLIRDLNHLSDKRKEQVSNWLVLYCIKLHP